MTRSLVVVVKVGGSLLDWPELPVHLTDFLKGRRSGAGVAGGRPILIAGGGRAADLVRRLDQDHRLDDETAHRLAIHAMDLTARFLTAILPGSMPVDRLSSLEPVWSAGQVPVLMPTAILDEIERPGAPRLPPSWETTSDSIAARVAVHLQAQTLILLKSASLPPGANRKDAVRLKWVDPLFPIVSQSIARVAYLNLRDPSAGLVALPVT